MFSVMMNFQILNSSFYKKKRRGKLFITSLLLLALTLSLSSCGIWNPADVKDVPVGAKERVKKNLEEGRGITLGGLGRGGTNYDFATSNPMWRATLEILDFLPLSNVDYSGGIISTDWYNEGTGKNESVKITIRFLSNEIRADGIKVIVHKKLCNQQQNCTIKKVKSVLENELKAEILKEATILERYRTEEKVKAYRKKNRKSADRYN